MVAGPDYNSQLVDNSGGLDPLNQMRGQLYGAGNQAGAFGNQGAANYGAMTGALGGQADILRRLQSGQDSVSQMQLQQNLQRQLAQQQAMAAGGNPNNAAMAARNAAQNMGQASYGMSGQQAIAGLQERQNATSALNQMLLGQRGQDVNAALGGYGAQVGAYGAGMQSPPKTQEELVLGMLGGLAGGVGHAVSDRRLKHDVVTEDNDRSKSRTILENLKPYTYKYKDERFGKGDQYGVMAQDMEKAGLGHAVMDTPYGKMVHAGKAATSALALTAHLSKRLEALEQEREGRGRRSVQSEDDE